MADSHGHHILEGELEAIKDDTYAEDSLAAELDARYPGVGQVVTQTVGINHTNNDAHYHRAKRKYLHPIHVADVEGGAGEERDE